MGIWNSWLTARLASTLAVGEITAFCSPETRAFLPGKCTTGGLKWG
ncbi:hypothetical protein ACFFWC_28180 [Plantactinospora siamensis]|uniref:Uncharacterized protein n=1 Tax=Plantactinospora siamensis TaxID=555372 RepID=A0ABV6NQ32_9ACTN